MIELLLKGQGLLIALLSLVMGAGAVLFRARVLELVADRASQVSHNALDQRVGGVEGRLSAVETAMRHLPTSEQFHSLNVNLTDLRGEMRSMAVKISGVETMLTAQGRKVELIDEHLRRGAA